MIYHSYIDSLTDEEYSLLVFIYQELFPIFKINKVEIDRDYLKAIREPFISAAIDAAQARAKQEKEIIDIFKSLKEKLCPKEQ